MASVPDGRPEDAPHPAGLPAETGSVAGVRGRILDRLLVLMALVPLPVILVSLPRGLEFGFRTTQYVSHAAYLVAIGVALRRRRLSYRLKAYFLLAATFLIGVASLWDWGLLGMYVTFFIGSIFIAALLVSFRAGLLTLAAAMAAMGVMALVVQSSTVLPQTDYEGFLRAPSTWALAMGHVAVFALLILIGFERLHQSLVDSVALLARRSEELARVNARLQAEIGVRTQTERKTRESEERYRLLADHSTDMIWTMDLNLRVTYVSPQVESLRGYTVREAMAQPLAEVLTPASLRLAEQTVKEELALWKSGRTQPGRVRTIEVELLRKDGGTVWTETRARFLRDEQGRPLGVLGVSRDVSERRRLEDQLLQSQKMEAIGRLAGGVAHDFNNQLLVILGMAQVLESQTDPNDPRRRSLGMIRAAAERSAGLTRQLLAFSRRQAVQPVVVDLNSSLTELQETLGRMIGEDVHLGLRLGADPAVVRIDPVQFEQVVFNLAVNARDAMPAGGSLVIETAGFTADEEFARAHPGTAAGAYLRLAVSDTGVGMDKKTMARVFEPFFTTKGRDQGTGLGLSTVYGIVRQAGGAISVHSEPGVGTTFDVYLPAASDTGRSSVAVDTEEERFQGSERVLVVEDDALVREATRGILEGSGYQVVVAHDGAEALERFAESEPRPRLVVTDLIMPDMNGRELDRRLKQLDPAARVLLMSGYTDEILGSGEIEGDIDFIQKPFDRQAFLRKVRRILDRV